MTFGQKIKTARNAKGFTQKELADMVNAKHNSVSDWENDKSKPDMDTVELLCGVLDLNPASLMGTKTEEEYGSIVGKIMNDSAVLDMIEEFYSLSQQDRSAIRQIISSLNKKGRG